MAEINWKDKCWVTTIYLIRDNKVLLTWNKRLQTWIPVGGHIELGETPEEAIKREVLEETGFEFEFTPKPHKQNNGSLKVLKPHRMQIEDIPNHSTHINTIFIGRCLSSFDKSETDENEKLKWFSQDEILSDSVMLESVRSAALEALDVVSHSNNQQNNSPSI